MPYYDSDGSTREIDERRSRRERRPPRPTTSDSGRSRRRSYYDEDTKDRKKGSSRYDTIGKAAIVIGLLQVVAGVLQMWQTEKTAQRDKAYDRQRRKEFDRAKAARRRAEEKLAREQDSDEEYEPVRSARRIAYDPSMARSRSSSRAPRRIEPPPSKSGRSSRKSSRRRDSFDDVGYESDPRGASRTR